MFFSSCWNNLCFSEEDSSKRLAQMEQNQASNYFNRFKIGCSRLDKKKHLEPSVKIDCSVCKISVHMLNQKYHSLASEVSEWPITRQEKERWHIVLSNASAVTHVPSSNVQRFLWHHLLYKYIYIYIYLHLLYTIWSWFLQCVRCSRKSIFGMTCSLASKHETNCYSLDLFCINFPLKNIQQCSLLHNHVFMVQFVLIQDSTVTNFGYNFQFHV